MAELKSVVVAQMAGGALSLQEFLHGLKTNGQLAPLIDEAVRDRLIRDAARREHITAADAELQAAADRFRAGLGLNKAADTHRWLQENHLTLDELESSLEAGLLRRKLRDKVVGDRVAQHFTDNRTRYDRARIAHLLVDSAGAALEMLSQVREDGASFADLARRHSLDEGSREAGGSLGPVSRADLGPAAAPAVFGAHPGDVVGPFPSDAGHHLVLVEEILSGELTEETAENIRDELFEAWLEEELRKAAVDVKLYASL